MDAGHDPEAMMSSRAGRTGMWGERVRGDRWKTALVVVVLLPFVSLAETDALESETRCVSVADACPTGPAAFAILGGAGECDLLSVDDEATISEDQCCYPVTVDCSDVAASGGCGCGGKR